MKNETLSTQQAGGNPQTKGLTIAGLTSSALDYAENLDDYEQLWRSAEEVSDMVRWIKGEIAIRVVSKYGEGGIDELALRMDLARSTIDTYRRVTRAFPVETRRESLTWSHYVIASQADSYSRGDVDFATDKRFEWIDKAEDNNWSARRLAVEIKKELAIEDGTYNESAEHLDYVTRFRHTITQWKISQSDAQKMITELKLLIADLEKQNP